MLKANRMNRTPGNHVGLHTLEERTIARRERVGIRNIVKATTGAIIPVGFDIVALNGPSTPIPGFNPYGLSKAWVDYNGGRACLKAAQPHSWLAKALAGLPANQAATALLNHPDTKGSDFDERLPILGDALLISDTREHCILQPRTQPYQLIDMQIFSPMLRTPHDIVPCSWKPWIFFHKEPCASDIFAMNMRW